MMAATIWLVADAWQFFGSQARLQIEALVRRQGCGGFNPTRRRRPDRRAQPGAAQFRSIFEK
jgi:hypothetical protein